MYLLKLALRPWRLAPLSQVFSAGAVGLLLLLTGFLFWLQNGLKPVLARLQGEQVITAYLAPPDSMGSAMSDSQITDSIRAAVSSVQAEIKLVEPSGFLALMKDRDPNLGRELEDLGDEMKQVVPRYVTITGVFSDNVLEKVKSVPGVESTESSKNRYRHIVGAFGTLRTLAQFLAGGICIALLTGLIHLAKMNSYLHRDALDLLKFWGAGDAALKVPGMASGFFVGLLGGLLACSCWFAAGNWMIHHVRTLSPMLAGIPSLSMGLPLLLIGGSLGFLAGAFGNWASEKK